MSQNGTGLTPSQFTEAPPRVSEWRRFRRVFLERKLVVFGMVVVFILIFVAIFANVLAPYNPYVGDLNEALQQPNWHHLLGPTASGATL